MIQQIFSIARNTFTESIRQPIFAVLILVGALAMVLNPMLSAYSMEVGGGDNKMLIDLGLSTIFFVSLLLAAFTATGVLSSEIEHKTALTVIAKPVARPSFVVGKFIGVTGAIAVAYYILAIIFLLTVRHRVMSTASDQFDMPVITFGLLAGVIALSLAAWGNYYYRWVFSSSFVLTLAITMTLAFLLILVVGKGWVLQSPAHQFAIHHGRFGQVMIGLVLVFEGVALLTAVAIAASTRLGQIMTLLVCLGVFMIGLVSNSLNQMVNPQLNIPPHMGWWSSISAVLAAQEAIHVKIVFIVTKLVYLLAPNLQFIWPADAITQGTAFSGVNVVSVTAYAVLYTGMVLGVAVALFQTREVG